MYGVICGLYSTRALAKKAQLRFARKEWSKDDPDWTLAEFIESYTSIEVETLDKDKK